MTIPTHKQAFARFKEFKWQLAAIAIGFTVGLCAPPPAHAQTRDPYYTRYPFQTPSQIGRQLHDEAVERRREDRREEFERELEAQRRANREFDQFERDLRRWEDRRGR